MHMYSTVLHIVICDYSMTASMTRTFWKPFIIPKMHAENAIKVAAGILLNTNFHKVSGMRSCVLNLSPVSVLVTSFFLCSCCSIWYDHHNRPGCRVCDDWDVRWPIRPGSWNLSAHHYSGNQNECYGTGQFWQEFWNFVGSTVFSASDYFWGVELFNGNHERGLKPNFSHLFSSAALLCWYDCASSWWAPTKGLWSGIWVGGRYWMHLPVHQSTVHGSCNWSVKKLNIRALCALVSTSLQCSHLRPEVWSIGTTQLVVQTGSWD